MEVCLLVHEFVLRPPAKNYDYPFSPILQVPVPQAPVMTIYGRTAGGVRVSLHVHKVSFTQFLPFLYAQLPCGYDTSQASLQSLARLLQSKLPKSSPMIHDITTVTRTSFYGYHSHPSQFLHIFYYDKDVTKDLMNILSSGDLGVKFQPYEAHIDVFQHFYAAFNLRGMSFFKVKVWTYRRPVRAGSPSAPVNSLLKETPSSIEADCLYSDIEKCPFDKLPGLDIVEIPSILQMWREQIEESRLKNEPFPNILPPLPLTRNFPHDFMQLETTLAQFQYLASGGGEERKDVLAMDAVKTPIGQQTVNEDDEKLAEDLLDLVKPKGLMVRNKPSTPSVSAFLRTPVKPSTQHLLSTDQRLNSDEVRAFYHSDYNRSSVSSKPDCAYPSLHLSVYTQEAARGIMNKTLLDLAQSQSVESTPGKHPYQISPNTNQVVPVAASRKREKSYLTYIYLEVFPETRPGLSPDPLLDRVHSILYQTIDDYGVDTQGVIAIRSFLHSPGTIWGEYGHALEWVETEVELMHAFCTVWQRTDPDLVISFDTSKETLGYLIARSQTLKLDLTSRLTRRIDSTTIHFEGKHNRAAKKIQGRIVFDAWRMVKSEIKLQTHSFSNMVYQVLGHRIPCYSWDTLHQWMHTIPRYTRVLDYFRRRLELTRALVEHFGFIDGACQLARIYGVDLLSVVIRGSQFRVESILKRYCLYNTDYLLLSATEKQVKSQKDLESIPLVLEPEKSFSDDPVIVLDFQSLYPSIMIAYNLCFSTCLGKLRDEGYKQFGVTFMKGSIFSGLQPDDIHVTPNNVGFLRTHKRIGIIPRLMHVLLQTRIMTKEAMKKTKPGTLAHSRLMHQQLGLKLLCNTTYGYTGAGHTGRMPCSDLADAIVSLARRTLETAKVLVEENREWGAEVIYGDTDSLMIKLPGKTVAQAFALGKEIAQTINSHNPAPIEILLEKVYCPFLIIAKKHYSGLKYDSPTADPCLDSKGLEAIRRDSCSAASIMQEKVLNLLFRTKDLYQVYQYLSNQWNKILCGQVRLQDFVIYKKVMMGSYKVPPHAAIVAEKKREKDRMAVPHFGERVGYVVAAALPGAALKEAVVAPEEFLSRGLSLNYDYYLNNQILPILGRVLEPIQVKVNLWYESFPRRYLQPLPMPGQGRVDQIFSSNRCLVCGVVGGSNPCEVCKGNTRFLAFHALARLGEQERHCRELMEVCRVCTQQPFDDVECCSLECPIFSQRTTLQSSLTSYGPRLSSEVQTEPMISQYLL